MPPRKLAAIFFVLCAMAGPAASQSQPVKKLTIASTRHADDDLEVTGMVAGLSARAVGYVSYAKLVALPQVTTTMARR